MRTIKFRGKSIDNGEWVYGNLLSNGIDPYIQTFKNSIATGTFEVDPKTVGQFTGLKDKNGSDIYEGDVVNQCGLKMEVKFRYGCFFFATLEDNEYVFNPFATDFHNAINQYIKRGYEFDGFLGEIAIIGNIHDNPELIG